VRGAGNEARLERQRKVLGRAAGAVGREGSLQSASGEEGAATAHKEGTWPIQLIDVTRWVIAQGQKRHTKHSLPLFQLLPSSNSNQQQLTRTLGRGQHLLHMRS